VWISCGASFSLYRHWLESGGFVDCAEGHLLAMEKRSPASATFSGENLTLKQSLTSWSDYGLPSPQ